MICKKPEYEYFDDGHIMCKTKCKHSIEMLIANERDGKQKRFMGCPPILSLFYQRENWLRLMGIQKANEQTRNLILINTSEKAFQEAKARITAGKESLLDMERVKPEEGGDEKEEE